MKKLIFALVGTAALLTAACNRGNEDQVNNAEVNQPASDLNALANNAANVANEADALNAQAQNLANESTDNTVNPKDADEQNVSGM
jgi:peptidoglycan hydrolase CwlO-like protein